MLLTIRKQAWGKAEPTEIVEQWEANSPYEMAKPIFSKCDDGTYYTMVKDKVSGKVLTPMLLMDMFFLQLCYKNRKVY
jgi:hypothetical protein